MKTPAVLGGPPAFDATVPIMRPTLPSFDAVEADWRRSMATGMLSNIRLIAPGEKGKVTEFEEAVAAYLGVRHAVATSSCTTGLMLAARALGMGSLRRAGERGAVPAPMASTGAGPVEVLLPSFTFSATGHMLVWNGAEPVFVDCDRETHQIDPEAARRAITERTRGMVGVHVFGSPCDAAALEAVAAEAGVPLLLDAAHGMGARYADGPVGIHGDAEVFSLSPTKVLVSGEGGIVATDRDDVAEEVRMGRDYGNPGNYDCVFPGMNARMSEIHAALGLRSLAMLEENVARRNALVDRYKANLGDSGLAYQRHLLGTRSTYKDISLIVDAELCGLTREQLAKALGGPAMDGKGAEMISTKPYFDPPLHRQQAYAAYRERFEPVLPNTAYVCERALSIPLWSHMGEDVVDAVSEAIQAILADAEAVAHAVGAGAPRRTVLR